MTDKYRMADVFELPLKWDEGLPEDEVKVFDCRGEIAEYAVEAVNQHDTLVDQIDQLQAENQKLSDINKQLEKRLEEEVNQSFLYEGRVKELVACLRYYKEDCSGAEPSISVFQREVDRLLESTAPAADGWIDLDKPGAYLPDNDSPIDLYEDIKVWARWSDGEIELATYHYIAIDEPRFQRKCGTDENCEGWDGNVGYVTHWMPFEAPLPPKLAQGDK